MLFFVCRSCSSHRVAPRLSRRWYRTRTPTDAVTKTTRTKKRFRDTDTYPIPPLRRPLGVRDVPTAHTRTLSEMSADFLNQEKQLEKRRHLVKEATTGYFQDLHMTRVHGGKTWMAPKVLIREDKALYFPNIVGNRLDNGIKEHTTRLCAGKVSVIAMLTTKISELHAASYTKSLIDLYPEHPIYQYIQINLQENVLKSILVNLFLSSLRAQIPQNQHTRYLVSRQNMEYMREPLGMTNGRIGYVYLVDENLKIRWAACADAKPEEEEALIRCVGVLVNRKRRDFRIAMSSPQRQLSGEEK